MTSHATYGAEQARSKVVHSGLATGSRCLNAALGMLAGVALTTWSSAGEAQGIPLSFPSGVSGYEQQLGVTVLTRARPLYDTPGVRAGSFVIYPNLNESLLYNSNVNGNPGSGSWTSLTSGSVSAASDWSRDSLGASVGFAHNQFFSFPAESYTNWNAGLAGGYTIGDGQLNAAYSHQSYYQIGVSIGTVRSETPFLDQIDTAHLSYTFNLSRFTITPEFSASAYRFGTATVLGVPLNQQFLNNNTLAAGVSGRYSLSDAGGLLVVVRDVSTNYINPQPGQPSNNSDSLLFLGGIDYQAKGAWRYSVLVGMEMRTFQASQYPSRTAPFVEAGAIWAPTGLTTLTGTLTHAIENPQTGGTNGFTLTQARLVVDHELRRNILLQARGSIEYAQYLQSGGGSQTGLGVGAGVTWLLNRNVRLSVDCDFIKQAGSSTSTTASNPSVFTSGSFTQTIAGLTLHFAL